jgi:serine protease
MTQAKPRAGRRAPARTFLRVQLLEGRDVPSTVVPAHSQDTVLVAYHTPDGGVTRGEAVAVPDGMTVDEAVAYYQGQQGVAFAEQNYTFSTTRIPNDTYYGLEYALNNTGQSVAGVTGLADRDIDGAEAHDITVGSLNTVVSIIDTGLDYTHPDLYLNVWLNQAEIPTSIRANLTDVDADGIITFYDLNDSRNIGTGKAQDLNGTGYIDAGDLLQSLAAGGWEDNVDSGSNGYVDDLIGWDFLGNDNDPMDVVAQDGGHGTHVAGTIGAIGNNGIGVAGVAWRVQMMSLRFLGTGGGSLADAVEAVYYSVDNGAVISNNSWGGGGYSTALFNAISYANTQGQIFVAAAGNEGRNNDSVASYPANYNVANVVSVAATDNRDALASFSNRGRNTVDLGAPGVSIASTYPGGYMYLDGTSMATPQVSGAFALLLSVNPNMTAADAINRVLSTVDPVSSLATTTVTGGRLNVYRALTAGTTPPPPADTTGAYITSATPNASGPNPVSSVRVVFSEAINAATFTAADVTLTGPGGATIAITSIAAVDSSGREFDIRFASQSAVGSYTLTVGPSIADVAGNLMDQDRDGVKAEATQDRFTGGFTVTAPTQTTFSTTTPVNITDNAQVVSQIAVGSDITIGDIDVRLNITHTYVSDLRIYLRGPDGTTVQLFNRRGGSGDNFTNTLFSDEAATAISGGAAPYNGTYRPEQLLSAFDGKNARGTWQLIVQDLAGGDVGRINSWSLTVVARTTTMAVGGPRPITFDAPVSVAQSAVPASGAVVTDAPDAAVAVSVTPTNSGVSQVVTAFPVPNLPRASLGNGFRVTGQGVAFVAPDTAPVAVAPRALTVLRELAATRLADLVVQQTPAAASGRITSPAAVVEAIDDLLNGVPGDSRVGLFG